MGRPKERVQAISFLACSRCSNSRQAVPRSSKTVRSSTTENWRRTVAKSSRSRSCTVRTPPAISFLLIWRPTPQTSPTGVAAKMASRSGADKPSRLHTWANGSG